MNAQPANVLKFPSAIQKAKERQFPIVPPPKTNQYTSEEALTLYEIAASVKRKGEDFVKFVDQNRDVARQAGIEVLALQLNSILEGEKFKRVLDALQEAAYQNSTVSLTDEGVDKIHRLERLIADVDHVIVSVMNGRATPTLGQSSPTPVTQYAVPPVYAQRSSDGMSPWVPLVIISIAGIVGVIAIVAITSRKS